VGGESAELAELYRQARRVFAALADPSRPDAARLQPIGARLVESVLRPLAGCFPATDEAGGVAFEAPGTNGLRLADQITATALAATELLARRQGPPGLYEATAALQDLALRLVPPGAEAARAELHERLRAAQADLAPAIRSAQDGPYLVTNVEDVVDWLGVPAASGPQLAPQIALCRCGASALKPFCDGTHARIGFTSEKSPNRVADRGDAYPGPEVEIHDNRGLCAHSGFCTDRLSSVFHAGGEPFVTPAGGRTDDVLRAIRDCPSGALSGLLGGAGGLAVPDPQRPAAIEVSRDGPYRVTGSVPLLDGDGSAERRNAGASEEHYSLCRCGKSQNKPFCSGMHWYVGFVDPPFPRSDEDPTLFEWAGGRPALLRTTRLLYGKHVPQDALIGPLFAQAPPDQAERVAEWLGAVFGGPPAPAGDPGVVFAGATEGITEDHRARWVELAQRAVEGAALPAEPEFRASLAGFLEWASRIALRAAQSGKPPRPDAPVPSWDWVTGPPPLPGTEEVEDEPVALPAADEAVTFSAHVRTFFREKDRKSMSYVFDLSAHADVARHADAILTRVAKGTMPCDGTWPAEQVDAFRRWVEAGAPE
jgi:CDGSH-type Zn-finger protein/truncated hemoglobin YjbI